MSETLEPALPDHLDAQAERLMHRMCDREWTVATAESCTGGMLAALLTDIEGAGHGFDRGFVTYTKEAKADLLGIERELLDHNDAVSEVVARAMAEGALQRSQADVAIAVTGFAGPAGPGCEEGLVHFALARCGAADAPSGRAFRRDRPRRGPREIAKSNARNAGAGARGSVSDALFHAGRAPMAELIFYTNPQSRGRIVRWMLEEVGAPTRPRSSPTTRSKASAISRSIRWARCRRSATAAMW